MLGSLLSIHGTGKQVIVHVAEVVDDGEIVVDHRSRNNTAPLDRAELSTYQHESRQTPSVESRLCATHPCVSPVRIPRPRPVLVHHDRVDVLGGAKVLAGPVHAAELVLGRVADVDVRALPGADELFGCDGLELVEGGEHVVTGDVLALDELDVLLFRGAEEYNCQLIQLREERSRGGFTKT